MISECNIDGMGKGLRATTAIAAGTTLFSEQPLIHMQYSWNKKYKYLACDECMQPLEAVEQNLRRLTGDKSLTVPHRELCQITPLLANMVKCAHCDTSYCSAHCSDAAWSKYHKSMCVGVGSMGAQFLTAFEQLWSSIHYPPESSNLMILVKMVAMVNQSDDPSALMATFDGFCQSTVDESSQLLLKILDEKYAAELHRLHEMFRLNLYSESLDRWFSFEGFMGLIALVCRNSQGIATNSFALWMKEAEHRFVSDAEFERFVDTAYERIDEHVGEFLDNEGIGLYCRQSLINHSCAPNCEVKFSGRDSTLAVVATRDIAAGEQVYISYLEACQLDRSRHSRQKHLRQFYLFNCRCQRCEQQVADADETSDEEEEDDEGEGGQDCEMME